MPAGGQVDRVDADGDELRDVLRSHTAAGHDLQPPGRVLDGPAQPVDPVDAAGSAARGEQPGDAERDEVVDGGRHVRHGVERAVERDLAPVGGLDQGAHGGAVHGAVARSAPTTTPAAPAATAARTSLTCTASSSAV